MAERNALFDANKSLANAVPSKPPDMDMAKMLEVCNNEFIQSFTGIPVKVDVALEGKSYYIAVSPELLHKLEVEYESAGIE